MKTTATYSPSAQQVRHFLPLPAIPMLRLLLAILLLCPAALGSQTAEVRPSLRSGTPVRVFLRDGTPSGDRAVLVSASADTLGVISPTLGLVQLAADELQRLETVGSGRNKWTYAAAVLGLSAAASATAPGEYAFPMFMNGLILFGLVGGALYVLDEPGQRFVSVDPARGLPVVREDAARPGVPVRIATAGQPLADHRLRGFTADSVFLVSAGTTTPMARAHITSLQVSMGRDRGRGARTGAVVGAVAGGALAAGAMVRLGPWGRLAAPFAAVGGGLVGAGLGFPVGVALAPRAWTSVPVQRPDR